MATGAVAIERVAKLTRMPLAHVQRAARILREASPELWPEAGRGGGRNAAHVTFDHLFCLVIALSVCNPITLAPDLVQKYALAALLPLHKYEGQVAAAKVHFPRCLESINMLYLIEAVEALSSSKAAYIGDELDWFTLKLTHEGFFPVEADIVLARRSLRASDPGASVDVGRAGRSIHLPVTISEVGQYIFNDYGDDREANFKEQVSRLNSLPLITHETSISGVMFKELASIARAR